MRSIASALFVAGCVVACSGGESPSSSGDVVLPSESPSGGGQALAYFEGRYDVETGSWTFEYRYPMNEVAPEAVTIPWKTSGTSGAYLHTRKSFWTPGTPSTMNVGVSAENLYNLPILNFTAVVDSISVPTIGMCNVVQSGNPVGNNCAAGSTASTWSCATGSATKTSPGLPPCRLNYGTVNHTGADPSGAGDVTNDPGVPRAWYFVDAAQKPFTISGHVEGTAIPAN
jgi:hypothetical protein